MCKLFKLYDLTLKNSSVTTEEPQPDQFRRRRNPFDAPAYPTKNAGAAIPHVRDFPAGVERKFSAPGLLKVMVEKGFF